jgi:hypothetical protein
MRAKEFITEQKLQDVHDYLDITKSSLPHSFVITDLKNQDFYELYRFGVAIADVRGTSGNDQVYNGFKPEFKSESAWGENEIIVSYDPDIEEVIDAALKKVKKSGKKEVASKHSSEMDDISKKSPLKPFKGY